MSTPHIIRQQYLDVEVNGTESEGKALLQSLPDFCQRSLQPALARVLDRYSPHDRHLVFERLEIDLGSLTIERFEHDLTEQVVQAVEKYFLEHLPPPGTALPGNRSGQVQQLTEHQSIQDAFIYFLKTGSLPWSFQLPAGKTLEQSMLDAWRDAEIPEADLRFFKAMMMSVLVSVNPRKRLVRQFSLAFLGILLARLSLQAKQAIDKVLPILRDLVVSAIDIKYFERQLWETVFAEVALGHSLTDKTLVAEAWHSLPVSKPSLAALASLLEHYWPGTVSDFSVGAEKHTARASPDSIAAEKLSVGDEPPETTQALKNNVDKKNKPAKKNPPEFHIIEKQGKDSSLAQQDNNGQADASQSTVFNAEKIQSDLNEHVDIKDGIYLDCAGLVLLHPFLPQFFEALGLAADDKLLQPDRALCLLHFLATGQLVAPEYALILPKILCNMPLEMPVEADVELTNAERVEATVLLDTVIRYWDTLRNTSADGLRGNFLVRPGKVSLREDGDWLLQVESKSYDILLDQLPWGIGMIKLPWMQRMLRVEWVC
jgi:hypothetical protein